MDAPPPPPGTPPSSDSSSDDDGSFIEQPPNFDQAIASTSSTSRPLSSVGSFRGTLGRTFSRKALQDGLKQLGEAPTTIKTQLSKKNMTMRLKDTKLSILGAVGALSNENQNQYEATQKGLALSMSIYSFKNPTLSRTALQNMSSNWIDAEHYGGSVVDDEDTELHAIDVNLDNPDGPVVTSNLTPGATKPAPSQTGKAKPAHPKHVVQQLPDLELHRPIFIKGVSILNIFLLAYSIWLQGGFESLTINPWFGPNIHVLIALGAKDSSLIRQGDWWRFFTPQFLHVGVIHLAFNLSFQVRSGKQLEQMIGPVRLGFIYLLSGIGGNLLSALFIPSVISVGASSSLYGLLGVLLIDLLQNWSLLEAPMKNLFGLILSILISLLFGLLPMVDNFAHLGGLITGLLASIIVLPHLQFGTWVGLARRILVLVAIFVLLIYFVVILSVFYSGVNANGWCSFCNLINCIPVMDWCPDTP